MFIRLTSAVVTLIIVILATNSSAQTGPTTRFAAGEILVQFRPGTAAAAKGEAHKMAGGAVLQEIEAIGLQRVAVKPGDETGAIARYSRNPNVLYAEPNFIRTFPTLTLHDTATPVTPRDYYFNEQYALHNTGQDFYCWIPGWCFYFGTPDADIDAPEAWAISTGLFTNVKVAIIDSGIDYNHPDLRAAYAGGDDFTSGDHDPMDDQGHGTHVAGIIAAAMNNPTGNPPKEEGVVGVAPNARILAYKVCLSDGSCTDFAINEAIRRAITDGAQVINMSLGAPDFSQSTNDRVQEAWSAGIVVVAAAGNEGTTARFYPAAYDNVIAVAASDEDGRRASFSTYGKDWVEISAPGNVIFSSYPIAACGALGTTPGDTGCYIWNSGTSMASPHVAGAAALLWARGDLTTNVQVRDAILNSADPVGVDAVRLDSWTEHGGLNLHDAMSYTPTVNLPPVADAGPDQTVTDDNLNGGEDVTVDGDASTDSDGSIVSYEWFEAGTPLGLGTSLLVALPVGTHTLTLEVTDNRGATDTDTVTITVLPGNNRPIAANTSATTTVGTPVTLTLGATDVETCELVFGIGQPPASGTLGAIQNSPCVAGTPNLDAATVSYTPTTEGTFTFTFSANDTSLVSNAATATITVNPVSPPPPPPPALAVTGISPNVVSQSAGTVTFTISGSAFANGASVAFVNGTGGQTPRVQSVTWVSSTQLTASVQIRSGGPKKNRTWDVAVTNPGGATATGAGLLTITP